MASSTTRRGPRATATSLTSPRPATRRARTDRGTSGGGACPRWRGRARRSAPSPMWGGRRMLEMLGDGRSFGYLAYVDGKAAGWVNASKRSDYVLYRLGAGADPADGDVVGLSCFVIAPPYRRHGLAQRLLDRVVADASGRGVTYVEAYPPTESREGDDANFRGPRSMYEAAGFEPIEQRGRNTVMRRRV